MSAELIALIGDRIIGRIRRLPQGRLAFTYEEDWRDADDAYPLSLSMPLAAAEHGAGRIEPFLWGLLPDNERVLDRWARKFQVSARDAFGLLANVGEDCAGAVQFVRPDRLDEIRSGALDKVAWLDEAELAERLRLLREDHAAWRLPGDSGQFSLAGAQPKTALLLENGRWGIPSGRLPTTHILKPPTGHLDGHAENEHVCLVLARALGMPAATSRVERFGDELAIVIERYDRVRRGNEILRVHQEDMCQALAVLPMRKYQNEGGPSVASVVELLRTSSSERALDIATFIDAIAFNWLIAGTDAHAKNYSLLLSGGPRVRLAPLYDVASILPYDHIDKHRIKLSMKIGGEYRLRDIGLRQWRKLAAEMRLDESRLIARLAEMVEQIPDAVADIREATRRDGLDQPVVERLEAKLIGRAQYCAAVLAGDAASEFKED
jgi:serine/threonine-protein kinase HipA